MPVERRVSLADNVRLHVRHATGPLRPYALVQALASHARLWDGLVRRIGDHAQRLGRLATDLRRPA